MNGRWLYPAYGYTGPQAGAPLVAFNPRYIAPNWFVGTQWGAPWLGGDQFVNPVGSEMTQWGIPHCEAVAYYPQGWSCSVMGGPRVSRDPQSIIVDQRAGSFVYGTGVIYNSRQYVMHVYDPFGHASDYGTAWVQNANRIVASYGTDQSKLPITAFVLNAARQLVAEGFTAGEVPRQRISHYIQYIINPGYDATWVSRYPAVYNAARVLSPQGALSQAFGTPNPVFSNLQTLRHHTPSQPVYGTAFVAFAIRFIVPSRAIEPPIMPHVRVSSSPQYVLPSGLANPPMDSWVNVLGPYLKIIAPRWIAASSRFDYPTVRNVTPQLYPPGRPYTEFGVQSMVAFRVRSFYPVGFVASQYGWNAFEHRNKTIYAIGHKSSAFVVTHRVSNQLPDAPGAQIIEVESMGGLLSVPGIPDLKTVTTFGVPAVRANSIWPMVVDTTHFGVTWIRVQGCSDVRLSTNPDSNGRFGNPKLNKPAQITQKEALAPMSEYGKPRVSPHTIYVMPDPPLQAYQNQPPIGPYSPASGGIEVSRYARVSLAVRRIYPEGENFLAVPINGTVETRTRKLYALGLRSLYVGYPELSPRTCWVAPVGDAYVGVGTPGVALTETWQPIVFTGWASMVFGPTRADNLNRPIYPQGFSATQWGDNTPMVHYPRHFDPQGLDATQWGGGSWVSHKNRAIYPEGSDMFESWLTRLPGLFVRVNSRVTPVGTVHAVFGGQTVSHGTQKITPYMIPPPRFCPRGTVVSH